VARPERYLLAALGLLVLLAVGVIFVGPQLQPSRSEVEEDFEPGDVESMSAEVIEILEEGTVEMGPGTAHPYQLLLLRVDSGSLAGQEIEVSEGTVSVTHQQRLFRVGDWVYLERVVGVDGDRYYISDHIRTVPLVVTLLLFVLLVLLVGRARGLRSMVGTAMSMAVLFLFVVPTIEAGHVPLLPGVPCGPVTASVLGSIFLLAASTYLIYGWSNKAHAAVFGMMLCLLLTAALASQVIGLARLSGLSSDEGFALVYELGADADFRGLVLAGMIIGALGVLDDACVGQASTVFELANANRELGWSELFRRALNVGRDHIAALVNTLVLAYVGASLPLIVMFTIYSEPFWRRISREPIAEEIVRTLVGSIGLVLAVPITTLVAALMARWAAQERMSSQAAGEPGGGI
jgi:uncharacterized membrane protein